jgi:ABC-2 type transport system ATP-binding protein
MADLLRDETERGVPVLFSSHQLDLVERLCDHVVVLAGGRVVAQGSVDDLRARGPERLRLVTGGDAGWVRDETGVHVVDVDGPTAVVELDCTDPIAVRRRLLTAALDRGDVVELVRVVTPLSEIYREVTA